MPTVSTHVVDLLTNADHEIQYDANQLDQGRQGAVYYIHTIDDIPQPNFLLKLYLETARDKIAHVERNIRAMIAHFTTHQAEAGIWEEGLEALPRSLIRQRDGEQRLGVLMRYVGGQKLDTPEMRQQLGKAGLGVRLEVARQIAAYTARLHRIDVVPADVTAPNLLVDLSSDPVQAHVVDVDGGGIADGVGGYLTHPLVLGQNFGCWQPPEIHVGKKQESDEVSDRWTVAIAVHYILMLHHQKKSDTWTDIPPYFWGQAYTDFCDQPIPWPPNGEVEALKPAVYHAYTKLLQRVGPEVTQRFTQAFTIDARVKAPYRRPSAVDWSRVLERAGRWVFHCPCGEEFVAWDQEVCPFCGQRLAHARITDDYGPHAMKRDWLVNGKAIGLTNVAECARLERNAQAVVLTTRLAWRLDGAYQSSNNPVRLTPGREHWIEILPVSGGIGRFRVVVPA